jgi:hypothetical protein
VVDGIPLVKWSRFTMPKEMGGWGTNNLFGFVQALVAKFLWRLIHNRMLWGRVLISKYLVGMSFEDWLCLPGK